jgi:hypothetical protein
MPILDAPNVPATPADTNQSERVVLPCATTRLFSMMDRRLTSLTYRHMLRFTGAKAVPYFA